MECSLKQVYASRNMESTSLSTWKVLAIDCFQIRSLYMAFHSFNDFYRLPKVHRQAFRVSMTKMHSHHLVKHPR